MYESKKEQLNSNTILFKYHSGRSEGKDIAKRKSKGLKEDKSFIETEQVLFSKGLDENKEVHSFVGTKEVVDRDGDIVIIDGMDMKDFKNNPVVLWGHDAYELPIGKVVGVRVFGKDGEPKEAVFDIQFSSTEKGKEVETLVKEGILNATSIGFYVNDWEYSEDVNAFKFTETTLLEISIVNLPANQEALATDKSVEEDEEEKSLTEEDVKRIIAEALAEVTNKPESQEESKDEEEDEDKGEDEKDSTDPAEDVQEESESDDKEQEDTTDEKPKENDLAREILDGLREMLGINSETDSQEKEQEEENPEGEEANPKESEQENQQTDEASSEKEEQDDRSEESPEENTDGEEFIIVEDLDEVEDSTEITVIN